MELSGAVLDVAQNPGSLRPPGESCLHLAPPHWAVDPGNPVVEETSAATVAPTTVSLSGNPLFPQAMGSRDTTLGISRVRSPRMSGARAACVVIPDWPASCRPRWTNLPGKRHTNVTRSALTASYGE